MFQGLREFEMSEREVLRILRRGVVEFCKWTWDIGHCLFLCWDIKNECRYICLP
jgi:hypothetical protein